MFQKKYSVNNEWLKVVGSRDDIHVHSHAPTMSLRVQRVLGLRAWHAKVLMLFVLKQNRFETIGYYQRMQKQLGFESYQIMMICVFSSRQFRLATRYNHQIFALITAFKMYIIEWGCAGGWGGVPEWICPPRREAGSKEGAIRRNLFTVLRMGGGVGRGGVVISPLFQGPSKKSWPSLRAPTKKQWPFTHQ